MKKRVRNLWKKIVFAILISIFICMGLVQIKNDYNISKLNIQEKEVNALTSIGIFSGFEQISAGGNHSLAIDSEGNLWAWGLNTSGQLGNGTTTTSTVPIQILEGVTFVQVAAGGSHSMALDSQGRLWTWGSNAYGQLGISSSVTYRATPTYITGKTFSQISAGSDHCIAIDTNNDLWTWGYNEITGVLGTGTTGNKNAPVQINSGTKFSKISAGAYHNLAIDTSGNLWACGWNSHGQLGNGTTTDSTILIKLQSGIAKVSAGWWHSMAIDTNGNLWAWGDNTNGELGNGGIGNETYLRYTIQTIPVQIKAGTYFSEVDAGASHTIAIDKSGNLWTWGSNTNGELGNGSTTESKTPIKIKQGTTFSLISAGNSDHNMAIDSEGNLWTWGSNANGKLGNESTTDSYVPIQLTISMIYSITLNTNSGTINSGNVTSYTYGIGATLPTDVTREGYTFGGWYDNSSFTGSAVTNITTSDMGDKTYYAKWTINQYTVTFKNGTETVKTEKVNHGASATAPELTKEGYTLSWDKSFSNVTGNLTVNAVWTASTDVAYKVEHYKQNTNLNGYELADTENKTGTTDAQVSASAKTYTGFTENTSYNGRIPSGTIAGDGSLVLKLYYDRNSYNVTLNTNEGTVNSGNVTSYKYGIGATLPTNVTKTGHTFGGWYSNLELTGNVVTKIEATETGSKEYYAKWTINQYTVIFKNGTDTAKTEIVNYGSGATAPTLTKAGYTLSWDKSFNNVTSDLTVNAVWTANTDTSYKVEHYKQNISLNGYDLVDTENKTGTTDTQVTAISKTYEGFTENAEYEERVASGVVAGDGSLVLKLYYDRNSYNVTLNTNGGTVNDGNVLTYTYGVEEALPTDITKPGYTFAGWYNNEELLGDVVTSIEETEIGDKTYYASWTINQYTVTFKDGDTVIKTETVNYGTGATAPELTKPGYTLTWDKDFSNITEDLTVNAIWTANTDVTYKIEHYRQDVTLDGYTLFETQNLTGTVDTEVTAAAKIYTGFTENVEYEGKVASGVVAGDGSLVLKLYYDRNSYNVVLNTNGGTVNSGNVANYTYGIEVTLPTDITKTGYTFAGWYDNEELDGEAVTSITTIDIGDKEYFAKWTASTDVAYKVEHYKQNTSLDGYDLVDTENKTGTSNTQVTATSKTYEGFTENAEYEERVASGVVAGDGSLVLKLYYDRNNYNVTLNTNGGTVNDGNVLTYTYGVEEALPTDVTKDGYVFVGWYDNEGLTGEPVTAIIATEIGDKTYYAKWTINQYTVTFKNGDTVLKTETVNHGTGATAPELTELGYTLSWDKEFSNITQDLTVNAIWTANTDTVYKVEHYRQDVTLNTYTLFEIQNLTGTTDTEVTATAKTYTGFTENAEHEERVSNGTVAGDGSLVLKLYYDRNSYNVTLNTNEGTINSGNIENYTYGIEVTLPTALIKEGYIFVGWYDNEELTGDTVAVIEAGETGDKTYYAKWILEEQYYIKSEKYSINMEENQITKVSPYTDVKTLISNVETNGNMKVLNLDGEEAKEDELVGTGYKIQVDFKGTKYEYEVAVRGDLNGDGKITVTDLSTLNQILVKTLTVTGIRQKAADIDYSGKVSIVDLSMMNQSIVGMLKL